MDYALYRGQYPRQSDIEQLWGELQLVDPQQTSDLLVQPVTQSATSSSSMVPQNARRYAIRFLDAQNLYPEKEIGFDDFGNGLEISNMEYMVSGFISPASMDMMSTPLQ